MPFVEVATSVRGLVQFLVALAKTNVVDCQADAALRAELNRRCGVRESIKYERDTAPRRSGHGRKAVDRWTCFSLLVERAKGDSPLIGDCEDLTAVWGAYLLLSGYRVAVCITQPREGATAHAYLRVRDVALDAWRVWDPSAWHGMHCPSPDFYVSGETYCCELSLPC